MRKMSTNVSMPQTAFGSRAANSPTPKICMAETCSQLNNGGFSQKG